MLMIGLGCAILLAGACMLAFQPKEIKADKVYGKGKSDNQYSLSVSLGGENKIPSTLGQYNEVSDSSAVNIVYTVVYEQNKWFKNDQRIIKLLRFERPFPEDKNEDVKDFYYRLVDESLDVLDDQTSVFTRLYEKRVSYNNLFDLIPQSIVVPGYSDIKEARQWISQNHPQHLELMDRTIVNASVLERWEQDGYMQRYSEASPEGLTLDNIIKQAP
ncbi:hypothetical protein [Paenibacillus chungangensis]|uniref:DUF4825 domain-containing protein n=1 Tax=Paenibacillus chungangensis TaxID=696535 RepID=A0ABW3HQD1_9BACL